MNSWKSRVRRLILDNALARYLVLYPVFWAGYALFGLTGRTLWVAYFAFRQLYGQTRGRLNNTLSAGIGRRSPFSIHASAGLLGEGPAVESEIERILTVLRREGYHVLPQRLPEESCRALLEFARTLPAVPVAEGATPVPVVFDPRQPQGPRYDFQEQQLIEHSVVQALLADRTLIALAARYLEAAPINDLIAMWWSAPFGPASSRAAQLFHFDLDRISFLKVFVYLTDVGPQNGPHAYVRGSHVAKPDRFFEDRRFSDEEIAEAFLAEDIVELVGPAGTVIVADTIGLHKGKPLTEGCRLIFQFEFTNSLFGQTYGRLPLPADIREELRQGVVDCPEVYQRFTLPARKSGASA